MSCDTKDGIAAGGDLIDRHLIQEMQNQFCEANNVYAVCSSKSNGSITEVYGTKEERDWLSEKIDEKYYSLLLNKL